MECPNCNKTYDDEFKFCPYCGAEKPEALICPKCNFESNEYKFCPKCGVELVNKKLKTEEFFLNPKQELINHLTMNYDENQKGYDIVLNKINSGEIDELYQIDNQMKIAYAEETPLDRLIKEKYRVETEEEKEIKRKKEIEREKLSMIKTVNEAWLSTQEKKII